MKFVIHKIESNFWEGFYCFWSWRNNFLKKKKKFTRNRKKIEKNRQISILVSSGGEEKSNKNRWPDSSRQRQKGKAQERPKDGFKLVAKYIKGFFFTFF
jgi:hypothetical protein